MNRSRRTTVTLLLVIAGALTPLVAHAIGGRCWIFLPAHIPPLLAGVALGPGAGLLTGAATAIADLLWGGRVHGLAFLPLGLEFVAYGLCAGMLAVPPSRYGTRLFAIIVAMLAGRLVHFLAALALGHGSAHLIGGLFVAPWPGIVIQVVVLPAIAPAVTRAAGRR
jgi:hypothetical protein